MKTVLEMSFISELVMVDINIWNKFISNYSQMSITVDTGASVTTISSDILYKLGYDISSGKVRRVITASSVEYVRTVTIDKLKLGEIEIENIEVYAHSFPESSFSLGVLGLNVLRNYDVNLLFSKREIELIHND
jgi:predicted aspartyl protease